MSYDASNIYTTASGSTSAFPGQVIASATWNSIFTDLATNGLSVVGAALSRAGNIYCTATGTNAITLALANAFPAIPAYANGQNFSFLAPASSSGAVTLRVGALAFLKVFLANGTTQATTGDIISGQYYEAVYIASLDAAAGGFVIDTGLSSGLSSLTGIAVGNGSGVFVGRTLTGTAAEITVTNGSGVAGNPTLSLPTALTFTGKTVTGGTYTTPTINTPDINGGTADSFTSLSIRSTASAFDVLFANGEVMSTNRTLSIALGNANKNVSFGGDVNFGLAFVTTGGAITLTATGTTNVTLPTTGTLATLLGVEGFLNKTITLTAGTVGVAPLTFVSGTLLTSPAAGSVEYLTNVFYTTPNTANRGVSPSVHFLSLTANQTGTDTATAQVWFPGGGATSFTLPASTSYFFEGVLAATKTAGTTSNTLGVLFAGTATLSSIGYDLTIMRNDTAGTFPVSGLATTTWAEVATNIDVTTASTSANHVFEIKVKGVVRINGAGTFIPQFKYSAAPGGAPTIRANSYFRMYPIGTNTVLSVGNLV